MSAAAPFLAVSRTCLRTSELAGKGRGIFLRLCCRDAAAALSILHVGVPARWTRSCGAAAGRRRCGTRIASGGSSGSSALLQLLLLVEPHPPVLNLLGCTSSRGEGGGEENGRDRRGKTTEHEQQQHSGPSLGTG